jgi:hypothetical protein
MPPIADCVLAVLGVVLAFVIFLGGAVLGTPFGPLDLATVDRWAVLSGLVGHNAINADVWIINRRDPLQGKLVTPLGETFGPYNLTAEGRYYLLLARAKT